jgi:hypothetical protein
VYATMRDTKRHSRIDRDADGVDVGAVVDRYGA